MSSNRTAEAANFFTVQYSPSPALPGQSITATVGSTIGPTCFPAATSITTTGQSIVLRLDFSDACAIADYTLSRDYILGSYPAGDYSFEINACSDNPPPLPSPCNIAFQGTLAIGSQFNASVPTASLASCILMFVGLALLGLIRLRVRRYYEYRMAA